jgi:3-methyl-2-oxobutanoate hydroxymethyltransferase
VSTIPTPPRSDASPKPGAERVTVPALRAMKAAGRRITMVTAYDAAFARVFDEAGVDVLLVGDSLGMVVQGETDTLGVTLDEVVYHCRAVARGARRAHLVADLPFMSYQASPEDALRSAGRCLAEGRAHAVKLEGGVAMAPTVRRLAEVGIPVMGHVGLVPQSVHAMGGFKIQGRAPDVAAAIRADARAVADAGAYAVVVEGIPATLAAAIRDELAVPTIGIGAGGACDGQVLVCYDLLGLLPPPSPRFVRRYDDWWTRGIAAATAFREDVQAGHFPAPEQGG